MAKEYENKIQERITKLTRIRSLKEYQLEEIRKLSAPPSEEDIANLKTQIKQVETSYNAVVSQYGISTGGGIDVSADLGNLSPDDSKLASIFAKKYDFLSAKKVMYEDYSSLGNREEVIDFYKEDIEKFSFKLNLYGKYKKKSSGPEQALTEINRQIADYTVAGESVPKELLWAHKSLNNMVKIKDGITNFTRGKNKSPRPNVRGKGPREY